MHSGRVLLISYFFKPSKNVGAFRASSFYKYLPEYGWDVDVVTATAQESSDSSIIELPPVRSNWLRSISPIKDQGLYWLPALRRILPNLIQSRRYNAAILTGPPFFHFECLRWIQAQKPEMKIILDFRDPFANNPRRERGVIKGMVSRYFERRWTGRADKMFVVTSHTKGLISTDQEKITVIENGFDDELVARAKEQVDPDKKRDLLRLIYAGKFTHDRNPVPLLGALSSLHDNQQLNAGLDHFGLIHDKYKRQLENMGDVYRYLGQVSYERALEEIYRRDIGVVVCTGARFEPTTKIYDYIGLSKPVLLIGAPPGGAAAEIVDQYGWYRAAENKEDSIAEALLELVSDLDSGRRDEVAKFGRRVRARKLVCELEEMK